MRNEDSVEISEHGVRYARGVHIVSRRPELRVISLNHSGEIVREYTQSMLGEGATDQVIALIETAEALIQRDQLHQMEPWFDEVPIFIPPYESPEAGETALAYLKSLIKRAQGVKEVPIGRGVHCIDGDQEYTLKLIALTSSGERIAERTFNTLADPGGDLVRFRQELEALLNRIDPI
jgi:hypothetical protein